MQCIKNYSRLVVSAGWRSDVLMLKSHLVLPGDFGSSLLASIFHTAYTAVCKQETIWFKMSKLQWSENSVGDYGRLTNLIIFTFFTFLSSKIDVLCWFLGINYQIRGIKIRMRKKERGKICVANEIFYCQGLFFCPIITKENKCFLRGKPGAWGPEIISCYKLGL